MLGFDMAFMSAANISSTVLSPMPKNKQVISPLIGALLGDTDLSQSLITVLSQHEEINELGEKVMVIDNAIYWGALLQACIDFLLTAIILFVIFKIAGALSNAAKKAAEKAKEALEKKEEEEKKEEVVIYNLQNKWCSTIGVIQLSLIFNNHTFRNINCNIRLAHK